jgi:hypothetical protein
MTIKGQTSGGRGLSNAAQGGFSLCFLKFGADLHLLRKTQRVNKKRPIDYFSQILLEDRGCQKVG